MTENRHTPGPWEVEGPLNRPGGGCDAYFVTGSQGWAASGMQGQRTVAEVGCWGDRPNPEADAHLIAAAPLLLDALDDLIDQVHSLPASAGTYDLDLTKSYAALAAALPEATNYAEIERVEDERERQREIAERHRLQQEEQAERQEIALSALPEAEP